MAFLGKSIVKKHIACFTFLLILVAFGILVTAPSVAEGPEPGRVDLPSGNKVQLEQMGFVRAQDGWAISFSYVTEVSLQDTDAVRSEAAELFELHLVKVANTSDPKIKAAILFAYEEPKADDGRVQKRLRYATGFFRHPGKIWTMGSK